MHKGKPLHPYELIGSSALALHEHHASSWARRIANELLLLGYNTRPDQPLPTSMIFSLNKGRDTFISQNEAFIFLEESNEGLVCSEKKTGLWIQPVLLDQGAVLIKASRQFHATEQNTEFVSSCSLGFMQTSEEGFMQQLQNSSYLNADLLIQHYGGPRFVGWEKKGTLKCMNQNGSYACFVSEADLLVFKEQRWQVASLETKTCGLPLARVKRLTAQQIQLEVWDEKGFYSSLIEVSLQPKKTKTKLEILFTKIRMRSATQVSCSLGKKRLFLKQGDWLFKTPSGWHRLDKPKDVEDYAYHRLIAEVFIFDAIVKEQGRLFMKGTLFDETRMQMQRIQLPIQTEKKETKMRKKIFLLTPCTLKGCL